MTPAKAKKADKQFAQAVQVLTANGFSNSEALELLVTRRRLMDDFAGKALMGIIAANGLSRNSTDAEIDGDTLLAYRYAKSMMNARGMECRLRLVHARSTGAWYAGCPFCPPARGGSETADPSPPVHCRAWL